MRQSTGQVVPFPFERVRRSPSTQANGPEGAQILLFLGVRYERRDERDIGSDAPPKTRGRAGQRPSRRQRRA